MLVFTIIGALIVGFAPRDQERVSYEQLRSTQCKPVALSGNRWIEEMMAVPIEVFKVTHHHH